MTNEQATSSLKSIRSFIQELLDDVEGTHPSDYCVGLFNCAHDEGFVEALDKAIDELRR